METETLTADDVVNRIGYELTLLELEQLHHMTTTVHRWWRGCSKCKLYHRETAAWRFADKRVRLALHRLEIKWRGVE